jgi:hypothetical protein
MIPYQTQTMINRLAAFTDHSLNKAVSQWQVLPNHQFSRKPSPEKWSATQCLMHLNSYGSYYLPEIEKAIHKALLAELQPVAGFHPGWLGNYFTTLMLPKENGMPAKKMSAPKAHSPETNDNHFEVIASFIDQQEILLSLLQQAKQIDLNKVKVPVSIAKFIRLKLGDVLLFLLAHQYRHLLQIDRALEQAGAGVQNTEAFRLPMLND